MTGSARDLHVLAQRSADADLATLIQVKEDARAAMRKDNSAKNIAAFKAAKKALEDAMQQSEQPGKPPARQSTFESLEAMRRWLEDQGYKVSKSSMARHKDAGHIGLDATEGQAIKFAKAFLKSAASGKRAVEESADENRRLLSAKAMKEEEIAKLARIKRLREEGKLIPADRVSQDLAARAVMLKSGLKHLVQSQALALVHLVDGDPRKAPLLIDELSGRIEGLLSDYAAAESVLVEFEEEVRPAEAAAQEEVEV